jgi:hypothetical protein
VLVVIVTKNGIRNTPTRIWSERGGGVAFSLQEQRKKVPSLTFAAREGLVMVVVAQNEGENQHCD